MREKIGRMEAICESPHAGAVEDHLLDLTDVEMEGVQEVREGKTQLRFTCKIPIPEEPDYDFDADPEGAIRQMAEERIYEHLQERPELGYIEASAVEDDPAPEEDEEP